jgi:hypothetical protein
VAVRPVFWKVLSAVPLGWMRTRLLEGETLVVPSFMPVITPPAMIFPSDCTPRAITSGQPEPMKLMPVPAPFGSLSAKNVLSTVPSGLKRISGASRKFGPFRVVRISFEPTRIFPSGWTKIEATEPKSSGA